MPDTVVLGLFPWCLSPELYADRADYVESLADFVRARPAQTVGAFVQQSNAVVTHDVEAQMAQIDVPTQITYGSRDLLTSARFAEPMHRTIRDSEPVVFEGCAHTPMYESPEEFNQKTLAFLNGDAAGRRAP